MLISLSHWGLVYVKPTWGGRTWAENVLGSLPAREALETAKELGR